MHNAIVETIVAPICQVSPNYHLSPLLLLPSKNTSLLLSPLASPLHSYYFITQCTPYIYFYLPCSTIVFFPTMFSLLSFSHFLHYLWMSPCHQHISPYLPIIFQCYPICPQPMDDPSPPPCPCLPPWPHIYLFIVLFMLIFLLPGSSPTLPNCMTLVHYVTHLLNDPFDICCNYIP